MKMCKRESGDDMEAIIKATEVRKLNKSKLAGRKRTAMSTEDAIKEISVIDWAEDIINGSKQVIIDKTLN